MNSHDVEVIKSFIDSISINIHRTRGGSLAVVFTDSGLGDKPKIGAYFTGEEWIACQWSESGAYLDEPRKLDIILITDRKESA